MGCAGPTTPFGALNGFGKKAKAWTARIMGRTTGPQIRFTPRRQVLHDRTRFDVHIYDPGGVPENHEIWVLYNGEDVTSAFLFGAEKEFVDLNGKELRFTTNDLRLKATRDHHIKVVYRREPGADPVAAEFNPPTCPVYQPERSLASVPEFNAPPDYVGLINQNARLLRLNPHYVAGLIAQESGFDPTAISSAKALGLTQITSLGEGEVIKDHPDWPRFDGIENMSVIELKLAVMSGKVNARNEWRLDPERSIRGGVAYLGYLTEYWNRPDKRAQRKGVELSEVLLASYNSGAARVSRALERRGKDFLRDQELKEALPYVRKVVSYCDAFAHPDPEEEPMKTRPVRLVLLAFVLIGVAVSLPLQLMLIHGHGPHEWAAVLLKLTYLNWLVILAMLATAWGAWEASPILKWAMPALIALVALNNFFVAYHHTDFAPWSAWLATFAFGGLYWPLTNSDVRGLLAHPERRWWRTAVRKNVQVPVILNPHDPAKVRAETWDLSETGMFVPLDLEAIGRALQEHQRLRVAVNLGAFAQLRCEARVARLSLPQGRYPGGVGIEFLDLTPEQRADLRRYLSRRPREKSPGPQTV